ncbi:GGDEF domain-containing protein [Kineococcus sp. SYSU DK006]|uniref:GGDEF domain-containing protein n=1 Tax=Kineococcus sp. SYSU DK006 TaxID=3383127 RepID=UPI003D7E8876
MALHRRLPVPVAAALLALAVVLVAACRLGAPAQAAAAVLPGVLAVAVAVLRLPGRPAGRRTAWRLHAAGLGLVTAGYALFHAGLSRGDAPGYPLPADVLFVPGSLLVTAALLLLGRGSRDLAASVDAAIAVTGAAVAVAAVLVRPVLAELSDPLLVGLTALYPALDLLGLGLVLRLWLTGCTPSRPALLLAAASTCLLVGDAAFGALAAVLPVDLTPWLGVPFSCALLLQALALDAPGSDEVGAGPPRARTWSRAHWSMVGASSCVPPLVLLGQGLRGGPVDWAVIGTGALLLSTLSVTRVHHAVVRVQEQAEQLERLARTDALTGLPNRRSWDAELGRELERGQPLAVALLDLDHFKRLNDSQGHPAGDRVLREVAAAWRAVLPPGTSLARYGGEEFALLLPGEAAAAAPGLAERLRAACPAPQTVSVGLAHRRPGEGAGELLARADAQLYRAKAAGRDRVCEG